MVAENQNPPAIDDVAVKTLTQLLAAITDYNQHEEIDFGQQTGKEPW